jgi:alpha-beta hydrolase superfamily lysophospholipase
MSRRCALLWLAFAFSCNGPEWGAHALLHPSRRASHGIPDGSESFEVNVEDNLVLKGWWARAQGPRRGLIVWLHGVGDNKDSAEGLIERYIKRGFDVAAYDSRAHGASGGQLCTYGFYEKYDLGRVLDVLAHAGAGVDHTIVIGISMGGGVALQAAAIEPRVRAVAALAPFVELRRAATLAAPFWMSQKTVEAALLRAEQEGHFRIDEVSPLSAVAHLQVPLLVVYGTGDKKLPSEDAKKLLEAARSPEKQLVAIADANRDNLIDHKETWAALDQFVDRLSK